jgi:hypothetical protein
LKEKEKEKETIKDGNEKLVKSESETFFAYTAVSEHGGLETHILTSGSEPESDGAPNDPSNTNTNTNT